MMHTKSRYLEQRLKMETECIAPEKMEKEFP